MAPCERDGPAWPFTQHVSARKQGSITTVWLIVGAWCAPRDATPVAIASLPGPDAGRSRPNSENFSQIWTECRIRETARATRRPVVGAAYRRSAIRGPVRGSAQLSDRLRRNRSRGPPHCFPWSLARLLPSAVWVRMRSRFNIGELCTQESRLLRLPGPLIEFDCLSFGGPIPPHLTHSGHSPKTAGVSTDP